MMKVTIFSKKITIYILDNKLLIEYIVDANASNDDRKEVLFDLSSKKKIYNMMYEDLNNNTYGVISALYRKIENVYEQDKVKKECAYYDKEF